MQEEEEEWVKERLKEGERRRCASRLLGIRAEEAVAKGNNYVSDIYRLAAKVVTHGGQVETRSLIYKLVPNANDSSKLPGIRDLRIFHQEIRMYSEVLPAMERLLLEKDPSAEPLWPRLIGFKPNHEGLLIEDVTPLGYKMEDRTRGLDMESAAFALKALARFHALAAVLIKRGELKTADFDEYLLMKNADRLRDMLTAQWASYEKVITEVWKGEWLDLLGGLKEVFDSMPDKMLELGRRDETNFFTLNHGDFWLNNMLFKRDPSGKPTNLKIIDLQLCYCNSPCLDVHYLLYTSLRPGLLERGGELLEKYYGWLRQDLEMLDYESVPSFQEIQAASERSRLFGLQAALVFRPFMTSATPGFVLKQQHPDLPDGLLAFLVLVYGGEYVENSAKTAIKHFQRLGLIK